MSIQFLSPHPSYKIKHNADTLLVISHNLDLLSVVYNFAKNLQTDSKAPALCASKQLLAHKFCCFHNKVSQLLNSERQACSKGTCLCISFSLNWINYGPSIILIMIMKMIIMTMRRMMMMIMMMICAVTAAATPTSQYMATISRWQVPLHYKGQTLTLKTTLRISPVEKRYKYKLQTTEES